MSGFRGAWSINPGYEAYTERVKEVKTQAALSEDRKLTARRRRVEDMAAAKELIAEGIRFTGIRMHNGLHEGHTSGCVLYLTKGADTRVLELMKLAENQNRKVYLEITDA